MPLTQDRMITVLDEVDTLRRAFVAFKRDVESALLAEDPRLALAAVRVCAEHATVPGLEACAAERAHFARRRAANERNARNQRERRRRT
jgi:hypothetical protein